MGVIVMGFAEDFGLRNVPLENIPATNNVLLPFEGHFFVIWTFICICKTFDNKETKLSLIFFCVWTLWVAMEFEGET